MAGLGSPTCRLFRVLLGCSATLTTGKAQSIGNRDVAAKRTDYRAYMLRMWRARGLWGGTWRASLEDAETHEVRGFRDLQALVTFLWEVTREAQTEQEASSLWARLRDRTRRVKS